ncbi:MULTISPECIES: DUF5709 domain-containing protein [unclassified Streptomyces]|uniref:DUF5709 domain-containing protein n=1 Tax=unclassified Streptomyces TaxID=2593676 RepID=UPI003D8A58EC
MSCRKGLPRRATGDTADTDGERIDDQVGDECAGRRLGWDTNVVGASYDGDDYWARDVGPDGGAASAQEAAVHVVADTRDDE